MTMDFTPTPRQAELIAQVDRAVDETGGLDRARAFAFNQRLDTGLERALAAVIHPGELTLLESVLIAERLGWVGAATTFGLRAVVLGDTVFANKGPASARQGLAVVDRHGGGLARYAADAAQLLVLNEDQASLVELAPGQVEAVPSGAGFPVGRVPADLLESGRPVEALGLRARWALAMAAELSGVAHAIVELTAAHLRERVQFGRPLAHPAPRRELGRRRGSHPLDRPRGGLLGAGALDVARGVLRGRRRCRAQPGCRATVGRTRLRIRVRRQQPDHARAGAAP
jgi:hypothetical protein